jgi:hypothetical protein
MRYVEFCWTKVRESLHYINGTELVPSATSNVALGTLSCSIGCYEPTRRQPWHSTRYAAAARGSLVVQTWYHFNNGQTRLLLAGHDEMTLRARVGLAVEAGSGKREMQFHMQTWAFACLDDAGPS